MNNQQQQQQGNVLLLPLVFAISATLHLFLVKRKAIEQNKKKNYEGSCHCKAVKFIVRAPTHLVAWNCNCSICFMKKNWHFVIPAKDLTLLSGHEQLSSYQFNTKVARHLFCRICGVQAYYHPR